LGQAFLGKRVFLGHGRAKMTEAMIKNYLEHHFEANPSDNFKTEYGERK